jgi:hypothetical protein
MHSLPVFYQGYLEYFFKRHSLKSQRETRLMEGSCSSQQLVASSFLSRARAAFLPDDDKKTQRNLPGFAPLAHLSCDRMEET